MHVAPASYVHQHVEREGVAAAEFFDEFVVGPSSAHCHVDGLLFLLLCPGANDREEAPIGGMRDTIQQGGHDFVQRIVRLDEVYRLRLAPGSRLIQSGSPEHILCVSGEVLVDRGLIVVRLGMASQRRREGLVYSGWLATELAPEVHG